MIYVECQPDFTLVLNLGISKDKIEHAGGKPGICKILEKNKKQNLKGLIDEAPKTSQPSYIKKLEPLASKHSIELLYDSNNQNYIIMLCPELEDWILEAAKSANINVKNYGLPDTPDELKSQIHFKRANFQKLLHQLKKKSKMLKTLEEFIKR